MNVTASERALSFVRWFFNASPTWIDPRDDATSMAGMADGSTQKAAVSPVPFGDGRRSR